MAAKGKPKTGGRTKGTPNKKTAEFKKMLESKPNPVEFMLDVMSDESQELNLRIDCAKAVAPYTNRKKPTEVEQSNTHDFPKGIEISIVSE